MHSQKEINRWLKQQKQLSQDKLQRSIHYGLINGIFLLIQTWFLAYIFASSILYHIPLEDLLPSLYGLFAVILLRGWLYFHMEYNALSAAYDIKSQIRQQLLNKIQELGPAFLADQRTGHLTNLLVDGIDHLESYFAKYLPQVSLATFLPLMILFAVFPLDGWSGLILLITMPLIPLFILFISRSIEKLNQKQWKTLARMSAYFLDIIQGLTTLKLFNASQRELQAIEKVSENYRIHTMRVLRVAFINSLVMEFFATVSIALIAILLGFRLLWGEVDFLYAFFILLLAPEFYLPIRQYGALNHSRIEAATIAEDILKIQAIESVAQQGKTLFPTNKNINITLENISFSYPDQRQALNNISLHIEQGKKIALVGSSGSGKSTLFQLIMKFLSPSQGSILANNMDLSYVDTISWQENIAWLPQKPKLFQGTVIENIILGKALDQEKLTQAVQAAFAEEFILNLPQGYETILGEGGMSLSGGQNQRIALARAFYKDASLILLDEATASLDYESESIIEKSIEKLCKNRTVIMIAHRLHTIQSADYIYVLDQGSIIEQGNHQILVEKGGFYNKLLLQEGIQPLIS